jgi:KDO2-lipid IV(A) lauroyltransferase
MLVQLIPLNVSYRLAEAAGSLFYAISWKKRKRLERGFRFLFGGRGYVREIKRTFKNYALNSIEVFLYPRLTREQVMGMVTYEGIDNIGQAIKKAKGVILLHGHFGNEEFLMPAVGYLGKHKVNQLASRWMPTHRKGFFYWFPNRVRQYAFKMRISYRETLPVNFIYIDRGLKDAYTVLKNGEMLLLAADGREGTSWVEVVMLGKWAWYSQGPMRIALKTDAEVLPVFLIRQRNNKHRLIIERPLHLERTGEIEQDIQINTQKFVSLLSSYIEKYPCHYAKVFWLGMEYFKELA